MVKLVPLKVLEGKVSCSLNGWPPDVLNDVPQCLYCCSLVLRRRKSFFSSPAIILGVFTLWGNAGEASKFRSPSPCRRFYTLSNSSIRPVQPSTRIDVVVFVKTHSSWSSSYIYIFKNWRTKNRQTFRSTGWSPWCSNKPWPHGGATAVCFPDKSPGGSLW